MEYLKLNWKCLMGFLVLVIGISTISAYEIICNDNESGLIIWDDANLSENLSKKIAVELLMKTGDFGNCTLIEGEATESDRCKEVLKPVINILNSNILERNAKIERLENYRTWMYVFMAISILLVIREGWLWITKSK